MNGKQRNHKQGTKCKRPKAKNHKLRIAIHWKSENLNLVVTRFLNELDIENSEFERHFAKRVAGAKRFSRLINRDLHSYLSIALFNSTLSTQLYLVSETICSCALGSLLEQLRSQNCVQNSKCSSCCLWLVTWQCLRFLGPTLFQVARQAQGARRLFQPNMFTLCRCLFRLIYIAEYDSNAKQFLVSMAMSCVHFNVETASGRASVWSPDSGHEQQNRRSLVAPQSLVVFCPGRLLPLITSRFAAAGWLEYSLSWILVESKNLRQKSCPTIVCEHRSLKARNT